MINPVYVYVTIAIASALWAVLSYRAGAAKYAKALAKAHRELQAAATDYITAKRKAFEYFGLIEGVCAERDQWKRLYFQEAHMHGNAQQLLFSQLGSVVEQYRRIHPEHRLPKVSSAVETVLNEYAEHHPTKNPPAPALAAAPTVVEAPES